MTKSGLVALLGRPNVGKSTLVNTMVGEKVSITAASPNTTRQAIRGVITDNDVQVVLVDTPGLHRPKTTLGGRLNAAARGATDEVDVVMALIEAGQAIGPRDRMVLTTMLEACRSANGPRPLVLVNKIDRTARATVAGQLMAAVAAVDEVAAESGLEAVASRVEYFALSAKKGDGVEELLSFLMSVMPEGPFLFDPDEVTDVPEAQYVAELVREQLIRRTREELPHAIHCRVNEYEWPHITVEILVERESQKGMVIGKGGALLKDVGIAARRQLPEGCFLELRVSVEDGWQKRDDVLDRFGY